MKKLFELMNNLQIGCFLNKVCFYKIEKQFWYNKNDYTQK